MPNKARLVGSGTAETSETLAWPKIRSLAVGYLLEPEVKPEDETLSELICVPSVETQPKKFVAEFVDTDCTNKPPLIEAETVSDITKLRALVAKKKPPIAVGPPPLIVKFIGTETFLFDNQTSLPVPMLKKPPDAVA